VSFAATKVLREYPWPGNIRELRSVIESSVLRSNGVSIEPADLPVELLQATPITTSSPSSGERLTLGPGLSSLGAPDEPPGLTARQREERERIIQALAAFSGNQTRAAEFLEIPRRTLVTKLSVYGIPRPRKVTPVPRA
ncbi:MAG TPA: helix-turn-helix domain-containing protein, partial [Polyangiaceae bacterium]